MALLLSLGVHAGLAQASKQPTEVQAKPAAPADFSFGGILFPHVHAHSSFGQSTGDPGDLAVFHHDPNNNGLTVQGLEFGLSGRYTSWLESFAVMNLSYNEPLGEWQHEFEEYFAKIKNLPGGFELRGGRYLNRFGLQNNVHLHGWDWADQYLLAGRFLGEDGMSTTGGEVSWRLPVHWTSLISASVGIAPEHDHAHAGGNHSGEESEFEAEGALFNDLLTTANWTNVFFYNDFHQFRAGISGAWGDNAWGRQSAIYGVHFEYQWRENGFEPGGDYFRWRTEAMLRRLGAVSGHLPGEEEHHHEEEHEDHAHERAHHDEHGDHDDEEEHDRAVRRASLTEAAFYTDVRYGWNCGLELGLRGEWVQGIDSAGLDERFRISPGITWYVGARNMLSGIQPGTNIGGGRNLMLRLQYNFDHSNVFGEEHSVWAQVGFNFGGPEVR
ncbi:MAG: hypothetical protein JNJ83_09075 [Verrucomicrobiaceae bacterium]|nr:hypothetical protein [Verrucomicrobiaceae bacterium]